MLLPRRSYSSVLGRLLHDRTADRIARIVSRLPHAAATIIPFDTAARLAAPHPALVGASSPIVPATPVGLAPAFAGRTTAGGAAGTERAAGAVRADGHRGALGAYSAPEPPADSDPIGYLRRGQTADVEGRVRTVQVAALAGSAVFTCELVDATGTITALFYGRRHIAGIKPGTLLRLQGRPTQREGKLVISNPRYELLAPPGDGE